MASPWSLFSTFPCCSPAVHFKMQPWQMDLVLGSRVSRSSGMKNAKCKHDLHAESLVFRPEDCSPSLKCYLWYARPYHALTKIILNPTIVDPSFHTWRLDGKKPFSLDQWFRKCQTIRASIVYAFCTNAFFHSLRVLCSIFKVLSTNELSLL